MAITKLLSIVLILFVAGCTAAKHQQKPSEQIHGYNDYLLFVLGYGGAGYKGDALKLIWDGKYHKGNEGLSVNVVICFRNFDKRMSKSWCYVGFDLLPLQTPESNVVYINFQGYNRFIKYEY